MQEDCKRICNCILSPIIVVWSLVINVGVSFRIQSRVNFC